MRGRRTSRNDTCAASHAFERMHSTLSHRSKTKVPGGTMAAARKHLLAAAPNDQRTQALSSTYCGLTTTWRTMKTILLSIAGKVTPLCAHSYRFNEISSPNLSESAGGVRYSSFVTLLRYSTVPAHGTYPSNLKEFLTVADLNNNSA